MLIYDAPFNPPRALRIAGYAILAEFAVLVGLSLTSAYIGISETAIQAVALAINPIPCIFLGIAAKRLGKSWLLYGLLPTVLLIPPFALFSYYKLRSGALYEWLDSHATFVKDGV